MQGALVYITGLSGSGKTTLAKEVVKGIDNTLGIRSIFLDDDTLHECIVNNGYSLQGCFSIALCYMRVTKLLVNQGFVVVLSTISMFDKIRAFSRKL